MVLQLAHPETAARSCDACIRWVFDPESGRLIRNKQTGAPVYRPLNSKPPCFSCPKCSHSREKTPEVGRVSDLSKRNQRTLALYYEQQVVPEPVDDVMRRNFGIIYEVLTTYDRGVMQASLTMKRLG